MRKRDVKKIEKVNAGSVSSSIEEEVSSKKSPLSPAPAPEPVKLPRTDEEIEAEIKAIDKELNEID